MCGPMILETGNSGSLSRSELAGERQVAGALFLSGRAMTAPGAASIDEARAPAMKIPRQSLGCCVSLNNVYDVTTRERDKDDRRPHLQRIATDAGRRIRSTYVIRYGAILASGERHVRVRTIWRCY